MFLCSLDHSHASTTAPKRNTSHLPRAAVRLAYGLLPISSCALWIPQLAQTSSPNLMIVFSPHCDGCRTRVCRSTKPKDGTGNMQPFFGSL